MSPKTVCVIGAGPSGLVAAKTLAHDHAGSFHVTIFEQNSRIGGLWPISDVDDGLVNPLMCTNQSRHTVSFSDLSWPEHSASFPKAFEVGMYLQHYIDVYPGYDVRVGTKVLKTELRDGKWDVIVRQSGKEKETLTFDHLIIATGFFGRPKMPKILDKATTPVWHSSEIRDVKDLLTDGGKKEMKGKNIVVVGGQMSGVETSAAIAGQISSAANTAGETGIPDAGRYVVTHIMQKPAWIMPLFWPNNPEIEVDGTKVKNPSPSIVPCDLVTYNLGWRPPGPVQNTSGIITPEAAAMTHGFIANYLGEYQSELHVPAILMNEEVRKQPPFVTNSDGYVEFVRQKKIDVVQGRMDSFSAGKNSITVEHGNSISEIIPDIAAIVCATGFDAKPSIDFLPDEILQQLQFDPTDDGFPLALNVNTTISKLFPSLGFVGFYRSPYWGCMEMQARFLGKFWSGDSKASKALEEDNSIEGMLKLRKNPRRSQFPMGDYAFLMESFAQILSIKRTEPDGGDGRTGLILPARYVYDNADSNQKREAASALSIIDRIFSDSAKGKFAARGVFRGLQGIWSLTRTIKSSLPTHPSGVLKGQASFLPRNPTLKDMDLEYLYFEEGDFETSWGSTMHAKRSYVYHYSEEKDKMNVWFAKDDYRTTDYFFHELEFSVPSEGAPWKAKASHLCIEDLYNVTYEFFFEGAGLRRWKSRYEVKGPNKDYTIENEFTRPN